MSQASEHPPANERGYAFPTWEQALKDAFDGIERAYEHRRRTIVAAHQAGLSYHTIARAVGKSPAMVHKAAGGKGNAVGQEELLRSPAGAELHSEPSSAGEASAGE
jgi:hypothetical protein